MTGALAVATNGMGPASTGRNRSLRNRQPLTALVLRAAWAVCAAAASAAPVAASTDIKAAHPPVSVASMTDADAADTKPLAVSCFPASDNEFGREGFVRLINHGNHEGEVCIDAFDDEGAAYGPLKLSLGGYETVHFNSSDLEAGNPDKGLSGHTGSGQGDWRLMFASELDIEVLAYVRTPDGFLMAMDDVLPATEGTSAGGNLQSGQQRRSGQLVAAVERQCRTGGSDRGRHRRPRAQHEPAESAAACQPR